MPYIYESIRDYITIDTTQIRARFVYTESDLSQLSDTQLLASEVPSISRASLVYRYTSDPVEVSKTIIFEPVTVEASSDSKFNTIMVLADAVVLARYQLDTVVNISPGIPAIITLGSITFNFNDFIS